MLIDIRGNSPEQEFNKCRIFKSEWFDIDNFVKKLEKSANSDEDL